MYERFGLSSQLRRASVSILANIAEGSKREHRADYARFLNIAEASLAEIECLLILCDDLKMIGKTSLRDLSGQSDDVARMLSGLRRSVNRPLK